MKKINCRPGVNVFRMLICLLFFSFVPLAMHAHVIVKELEDMSKAETVLLYLKLGYQHILPLGFDHILFVLSLFFLSPKLKIVLWQSLAFTVAHSVTLGLAMYNVIHPSASIIEPLIALSIMYVALENVFSPRLKPSRIGIVFLFGLIHGLGFASALSGLGLPTRSFFASLIMFNVGVELGQVTVILLAFFLLSKWYGEKTWYRKRIVIPVSLMIAAIAMLMVVERV
jgi:hypothetical protein